MSQVWSEKDKRFDSIEEELELLGSSSENENQVPPLTTTTTSAEVQTTHG